MAFKFDHGQKLRPQPTAKKRLRKEIYERLAGGVGVVTQRKDHDGPRPDEYLLKFDDVEPRFSEVWFREDDLKKA